MKLRKPQPAAVPLRPSPAVSSHQPPPPSPLPFTLPSSLVNEVKGDTLNQSRSVKRHTTSSLTTANKEFLERRSAQDGILDTMAAQLMTVLGMQSRAHVLVNEVLLALQNCPHATKKSASPESASTTTSSSGSQTQQCVGTTGRHGAANGFTVTHNHTHFQQKDFRNKKGADENIGSSLSQPLPQKRIENLPPNDSPPDCKNGGEDTFDKPPPPSTGGTGPPAAVHQFPAI